MSKQLRHRLAACLALTVLGTVPMASMGCGGDRRDAVLDAGELLDRYERDRRRHDPVAFSEIDLGDFVVTQRHEPAIFFVRFHLYGVVPNTQMDDFSKMLEAHSELVRSTIRETVQGTELEQLNDPALGALKSDMILAINRSLQARILRDVVFGEFSFERG